MLSSLAMLGFLHGGAIHVETFEQLVQAAQPSISTRHVVREDLLASAVTAGHVTVSIATAVQADVRALIQDGARVVVCTCSTLGSSAEATPTNDRATVLRIDRPLAERLVASGNPILVVAALPSAMTNAIELLRSVAREPHTELNLRELPCNDAWPQFLAGDLSGYAQRIAGQIDKHAKRGENVMLAQASMASAVPLIRRRDIQVSASPTLGIDAALAALAAPARPP
jgi:hypothetical protein